MAEPTVPSDSTRPDETPAPKPETPPDPSKTATTSGLAGWRQWRLPSLRTLGSFRWR